MRYCSAYLGVLVILHKVTCIRCCCVGNATAEDGFVEMPLDYSDPSRGSISVFYRLLTPGKHKPRGLPLLAYLEGGPGREAPRPMHAGGGWLARALKEFRVVLVDQRGTGRSTRITHHSLLQLQTPQAQADYLACFRADNIVRDMEVNPQLFPSVPATRRAILPRS